MFKVSREVGEEFAPLALAVAPCHITGYQGIQAAIEKKLNIKPGQTTFDGRFTLLPTCCLGNCDKGPTMMIDEDTHSHLTPEAIPDLLEQYK